MTAGLSATIANQILDSLFSAAAFTAPAASYIQLHTGDPGAAGTASVSSYTTRTAVTWAAAAGGSKSISAPVTVTASWSGTNMERDEQRGDPVRVVLVGGHGRHIRRLRPARRAGDDVYGRAFDAVVAVGAGYPDSGVVT